MSRAEPMRVSRRVEVYVAINGMYRRMTARQTRRYLRKRLTAAWRDHEHAQAVLSKTE